MATRKFQVAITFFTAATFCFSFPDILFRSRFLLHLFCAGLAMTHSNQIGSLMVKETKMMKKRWKVYEFTHEIPQEEIKEVKPCGVCFCKLITDPEHLFA